MKNANPVCRAWMCAGLWLLAVLVGGCERSQTADAPKGLAERFDVKVGGHVVHMQLAVTMPEMERGLMDRRDLGPDDGMLFVYERPQQLSFWMRNTPTPLDIGFFDRSGRLEEIYPLQPFDETGVKSRGARLCLALEMNQGWFRDRGLRPGAQLDLEAVRSALKARGFDPERFPIGR